MSRLIITLSLLGALLLFNSCQQHVRHGSKHSRFSSDRIALFGGKSKSSKRSRTRKSRRTNPYIASKPRTRPSRSTSAGVVAPTNFVRYASERNGIVREANKYQGIPYVYGGKSPSNGFDCSGFVNHVMNERQIPTRGSAAQLAMLGVRKSPLDLNKGDLVFFGSGSKITHVGIVSMNDGENITMIHASSSSGITSSNITKTAYWNDRLLYGVDVISPHLEEGLSAR